MNLKNKIVFVVGLAVTGVPLVKVLHQLGAKVIVNDIRTEEQLKDSLLALQGIDADYILGRHPENLKQYAYVDLVVASPGVPPSLPVFESFRAAGIPIIGEIELAYQLTQATILAITGTNGKTTTTALTGAIFQNSEKEGLIVGNIGVTAVSKALDAKKTDYMIMEVSSFQLESVVDFHPHVAAILNLTPDHLNRHHTMKKYLEAKWQVFKNQTAADYAIINYDDVVLREASEALIAKRLYFSRKQKLQQGAWVEDGQLVVKVDQHPIKLLSVDQIRIPGSHNLENALAAALIASVAGISADIIAHTLKTFKGVAHRIEHIDTLQGVDFINDSKGTNPDASIKAIEAVPSPILLLAGGQDKKSDFTAFIQSFQGKVKGMVVYGETAAQLKETAAQTGFNQTVQVKDLDEAVAYAWSQAEKGDTILLSPACASWDMYPNFEARGAHFKNIVSSLRGTINGKKESL